MDGLQKVENYLNLQPASLALKYLLDVVEYLFGIKKDIFMLEKLLINHSHVKQVRDKGEIHAERVFDQMHISENLDIQIGHLLSMNGCFNQIKEL